MINKQIRCNKCGCKLEENEVTIYASIGDGTDSNLYHFCTRSCFCAYVKYTDILPYFRIDACRNRESLNDELEVEKQKLWEGLKCNT